ncbi:NAD(P)-dependent alcohol dehydrogenase [Sphingomonas parva]|uniref:NAD(P)-dependent alcohol dehydrogenase n=2 Tax=Sphingomonas parva TaxID=2555898 RepID=A0A4Y8ZPY2_9SPHN|nr:NAD(P)-dependent alcohol dehydrogenase [Sphingomonas parva]
MRSIGYAAKGAHSRLKPVLFDREDPKANEVEIEILFCGVCHSDLHQLKNDWGNTVYPCLPGHEIVGRVARAGNEVRRFKQGDLVGVGCMIDSCGACPPCKAGEENYCEGPKSWTATYNGPMKPDGTNTYGGYSDRIVVREDFVLSIPDGIDPAEAAPILCAGITTYSPLMHWDVGDGDKVGVVGFGGLGHMGAQLARSLGAEVYAITQTPEKEEAARALGVDGVIVSTDKDAMAVHAESFDFILDTIPYEHDVDQFAELLAQDGTIVLVGALEPNKPIDNMTLAKKRLSVAASLIGGIEETQEVLDHCARTGVRPQIEIIPIDEINEALKRVKGRDVRFRYVIDMQSLRAQAEEIVAAGRRIDDPEIHAQDHPGEDPHG